MAGVAPEPPRRAGWRQLRHPGRSGATRDGQALGRPHEARRTPGGGSAHGAMRMMRAVSRNCKLVFRVLPSEPGSLTTTTIVRQRLGSPPLMSTPSHLCTAVLLTRAHCIIGIPRSYAPILLNLARFVNRSKARYAGGTQAAARRFGVMHIASTRQYGMPRQWAAARPVGRAAAPAQRQQALCQRPGRHQSAGSARDA